MKFYTILFFFIIINAKFTKDCIELGFLDNLQCSRCDKLAEFADNIGILINIIK